MDASVIKGPVGFLVGLVIWLIVMPLILGAINGWYLLTVDACVIDSERVDRLIAKGTHANAEDAWEAATSTTVVNLAVGTGTPPACTATLTTGTYYTPSASPVEVATANTIPGGEWEPVSGLFTAGGLGSLIRLVLQAAGLAPPIAIMAVLGSFGQSFVKRMGGNPIIAAVVTVITLLLVATLLNSLVPFIASAFESIDPNRFAMFDGGLGNVSVIVRRFYGVVLVASLIMVAWSVLKSMKGGNALGGGSDRM